MNPETGNIDISSVVLVAGLLVALILALFTALNSADRRRRRLRNRIRRAARAASGPSTDPTVSVKRSTTDSSIVGFDMFLKRFLPRPTVLRERLAKTGRKITTGEYVLVSAVLGLGATGLVHNFFVQGWYVAPLVGVLVGLGLPHVVVGHLAARRIKKFMVLFPEALELMVRGLKSGLPIQKSMKVVAEEMRDPVGTEFRYVTNGLKLGKTMEQSLWEAAKRLDVPEFKFFVVSLAVQRETGGNLTETLENLAEILRKRQQMRIKVKAMASEAHASALIIGSLPFVMFGIIFVLSNDYVMDLFRDPRGMMMLGGGLTSMFIGIVVMARMIKFEV